MTSCSNSPVQPVAHLDACSSLCQCDIFADVLQSTLVVAVFVVYIAMRLLSDAACVCSLTLVVCKVILSVFDAYVQSTPLVVLCIVLTTCITRWCRLVVHFVVPSACSQYCIHYKCDAFVLSTHLSVSVSSMCRYEQTSGAALCACGQSLCVLSCSVSLMQCFR
jgi:hypothetical protein